MRKYISELVATFFLVLIGTGAIVVNQQFNGVVGHLGISLAFGIVVMTMIYVFGKYSGAHMNPAVTLAFALGGKFPKNEVLLYFISQFIGAMLASLLLKYMFPGNLLLGSTHPSGAEWQSFVLEILLTFFLMFAILYSTRTENNYAGFVIGFVVFLEAFFAGPICGASMNPIRSLSPALMSCNYQSLWLYILAPTIGAIAAMFTFKSFIK